MEILPREEEKHVVGAKIQLQQDGPIYIHHPVYYNRVMSTHYGFSEDSSDEDDHKMPLASEKSSVCCVCGDNIPYLDKLIEHFKTHTAEVHCHLCRSKFGRVMSLALHLKNAHPKHRLLCEICGDLFSCTWHLNGHMGKHQTEAMELKPVIKIEETEEISIKDAIRNTGLSDHSNVVSTQAAADDTCSAFQKCTDIDTNSTNQALHIKTESERSPPIEDKQNDSFSSCSFPLSQSEPEHLSFGLKEENDNENGLGDSAAYEVAAEEEIGLTEDEQSTDTDDDANPDSLPPGDTAYNPNEDLSSDSDYSDHYRHHRKTKRRKQQAPDKKRCSNTNLGLTTIRKKFGFQSDSPFCCYGKFANLGRHMDDCRNKQTFSCGLCTVVCENRELFLKHMTEKHPTAAYICEFCRNVFPRQDHFKNHICCKKPRGSMNLLSTPVTQVSVGPLLNSSCQGRPTAPALNTNQNTIKIIKITQTVNHIAQTDPSHVVTSLGSTDSLTLNQLLQTTPLIAPKVTNLVPQVMTVPQTLVRPNLHPSSCASRPKVPIHPPSVVRPLLANPSRMTLRIPTPSNPPFPTHVVVSFSPTVNVSTPALVSANKPLLGQISPANIRPLPVTLTSVACPTLVSALVKNNQPQVSPAQAPLQIVGMFMNQSRTLAFQKQLKQSWRFKTIFPCHHCGAISRQLSLRVRHRYLHRGSRLYKCQCGRTFQRQLYLLRHQVQHAESVRFVCVRCGNTFEGAHRLTCHKRKHKNGLKCVKKKCKGAFDCSCGQMFARPSALLWHMLKNSTISKVTRKNSLNCLCK